MTIYDAANILGLTGNLNYKIVKIAYLAAALRYHPDRNPGSLEIMKAVNEAFETLKTFEGTLANESRINTNYGQELADAINAVVGLHGLVIEICGSWVWVSGDTKTHKAAVKAAGYKWSPNKLSWYYRPKTHRSSARRQYSMDEIRSMHGSEQVQSKQYSRIA